MNAVIVYVVFLVLLAIALYMFGLFGRKEKVFSRLARQSAGSTGAELSIMRERAGNLKTVKKYKAGKLQNEIYEGLSLLRNLLSVREGGMTADMVLVKLSKRGGMLEPVYLKMLAFLRLGKNEEAENCMNEYENIPIVLEYASILVNWDMAEREALRETIITFQRSIRQSRETVSRRRNEIISDIVYLPAVLNVMLIFINFIYVGYFLEQREMISEIFG